MLKPDLDPAVGAVLRGCFALLFSATAFHKIRAWKQFAATVAGYRILPSHLARPLAALLPVLEISVATMLLSNDYRAACLSGAALLSVYAAAMATNLLRGRNELDCGCLGADRHSAISGRLVTRNAIMSILLAVPVCTHIGSRGIGWPDVPTVAGGVAALALLYAAANTLAQSAHLYSSAQ